jgi:hypothetical protein
MACPATYARCKDTCTEQYQALWQKLRGHYAYYGGLIGNLCWLQRFR